MLNIYNVFSDSCIRFIKFVTRLIRGSIGYIGFSTGRDIFSVFNYRTRRKRNKKQDFKSAVYIKHNKQ